MKTKQLSGIVGYEITPEVIDAFLIESAGEDIHIDLSSIGGYIYPALQIYNSLRNYKGKKSVSVNGFVASAASYIMSAFDHVIVFDNSVLMIHNAMNAAFGDYRVLEKEAKELKQLNTVIGTAYSKKTKKKLDDILEMMNEETYMYASEIVDNGFANEFKDLGKQTDSAAALANAKNAFKALSLPDLSKDISKAFQYLNVSSTVKTIESSVANAKKMIRDGAVDKEASWSFTADDGNKLLGEAGDDWENYKTWHMAEDTSADEETRGRYKYPYGKNGKVYRSALRAIASRAAQQGLSDLSDTASELIKLIDDKTNQTKKHGGKGVEKNEVLQFLTNMKVNGEITLREIAEKLGLTAQLVTPEHEKALNVMREFAAAKIDDPVGALNVLIAKQKADSDAVRSATLDKAFGVEEDNGVKNMARIYAGKQLNTLNGKELETGIENIKSDPVMQELAAKRADVFSAVNRIDHQDNGQPSGAGGIRVDRV